MKLWMILFLLLLVGCTKEIFVPVPVTETVYVDVPAETIYVNRTIYINSTCDVPVTCSNSTNGNTTIIYVASKNDTYTISLIRQLKWCEKRLDYNNTFYYDELQECEDKLDNITSLIED